GRRIETKENRNGGVVQKSTFARFLASFDFRLFRQHRSKGDMAALKCDFRYAPQADSTRISGHVRNMPLQKNHVDWNCRGSSSGRAFGGGLVICRQKLSASEH